MKNLLLLLYPFLAITLLFSIGPNMLPDSLVTIIFLSVPVSFGLFGYFVSEQKGNSPIIGFILCFIWSILGVIIVLSLRAKNKNYTDKFKPVINKILHKYIYLNHSHYAAQSFAGFGWFFGIGSIFILIKGVEAEGSGMEVIPLISIGCFVLSYILEKLKN